MPDEQVNYYNVRATDEFPIFSMTCISANNAPLDMLHINRLTKEQVTSIQKIEIQVDRNPAIVLLPDQHQLDISFKFHQQIDTGIETVTLMPVTDAGKVQYTQLINQFFAGNNGTAKLVTSEKAIDINIPLIGFTKAYRPMRSACAQNSETTAESEY